METNASPLRGTAIDLRASPSSRLLLVRYGGDLTTKARQTRQRFAARLAHNIRDALSAEQLSAQVRRSHDRIYVEGRIEYDSYELDGVTITTAEITVRELVMLSPKAVAVGVGAED